MWRVHLAGDPFDLDVLVEQFSSGPVRVAMDGQGCWLECDAFDADHPAEQVLSDAEPIVRRMNGVCAVVDASFRAVAVDGQLRNGATIHVVRTDTVGVRDQAKGEVEGPAGPSEVRDPIGPTYLRLAEASPNVEEVVRLLGGAPPDWVALYKIHEIVKDDVGPSTEFAKLPWVDGGQLKAFTGSANRQDVAGEDARHARTSGPRPKRTMDLHQARDFVRTLVTRWLDQKQ